MAYLFLVEMVPLSKSKDPVATVGTRRLCTPETSPYGRTNNLALCAVPMFVAVNMLVCLKCISQTRHVVSRTRVFTNSGTQPDLVEQDSQQAIGQGEYVQDLRCCHCYGLSCSFRARYIHLMPRAVVQVSQSWKHKFQPTPL